MQLARELRTGRRVRLGLLMLWADLIGVFGLRGLESTFVKRTGQRCGSTESTNPL